MDMIIITNQYNIRASVYLADEAVMSSIRERIGNFYILPSSIHEFIIIPDSQWVDGMTEMIKEINETLNKKDILSDNAYYYDGKLSIAD